MDIKHFYYNYNNYTFILYWIKLQSIAIAILIPIQFKLQTAMAASPVISNKNFVTSDLLKLPKDVVSVFF